MRLTWLVRFLLLHRKICQRLECSIDMVWAMLSTGRSMQQLHWQTYEQPASPFWDEPAWSLGAWSHLTMHHARLDSPSSMQSAVHWILKSWSSSWQVWTCFSFQSSVGILLLNYFFLQIHLFSDLKPPLCGSTQSFSFPVGASWLAQYYSSSKFEYIIPRCGHCWIQFKIEHLGYDFYNLQCFLLSKLLIIISLVNNVCRCSCPERDY